MNFLEALIQVHDKPHLLARPIGWRGGYYIKNNRVWDIDPLRLGPDLKTPLAQPQMCRDVEALLGEWEIVERRDFYE